MTVPGGGVLPVSLGGDLIERLKAYADACRRPVEAVVADAVEERLDARPDHQRQRAAGLAAVRECETEHGPFTEEGTAEADARIDGLFRPADDEHEGLRTDGRPERRGE
ncbi:hypothetical protein ACH5AO_19520 [Streptomyces sp. NPDC018964]|uniref:hypothetical protein n=1 Tax=unclassified Streptomyces TaxID=2593676 RepID=UPI0037A3F72C